VSVLAVGADAVAKLHAQRAVSERGIVGAAERERPLGVGEHAFSELEFLVGDATSKHEIHPHAVAYGLMRHNRAVLLGHPTDSLQPGSEKFAHHPRSKLVCDLVSERRRASNREKNNLFPQSLSSRDTRL
jgi:hypothetical protein